MRYKITVISDKNEREKNEDNFFFKGAEVDGVKYILALVCDGMGGLDSGEVASLLVTDKAKEYFTEEILSLEKEELKNEIKKFVGIVDDLAREISDRTDESLGTTLTLLVLSEGKYLTANIGDSRIYKIDEEMKLVTKDQTVFQKELDTGIIDEKMSINKKKSTLLQCIGTGSSPIPEFTEGEYEKNEGFLLCSDGMCNRVSIEEMHTILGECEDRKGCLESLVKLAKEKGERDNITGVYVSIL